MDDVIERVMNVVNEAIKENRPQEIDTSNDSLVAIHGNEIVLLVPRARWSKSEALRCAAWMVALADETDGQFEPLLEAVRNT